MGEIAAVVRRRLERLLAARLLVWLAAAHRPNDTEQREIVSAAATMSGSSWVTRVFRFGLTPVERARLWAFPDAVDDMDVVLADWMRALLVAAVIVVPVAFAIWRHSADRRWRPSPNRADSSTSRSSCNGPESPTGSLRLRRRIPRSTRRRRPT